VRDPGSRAEQLTRQFYRWEKRGRGWQVWDRPVELEPSFQPFTFHHVTTTPSVIDDARRPTRVGTLFEKLRGRLSRASVSGGADPPPQNAEEPAVFGDDSRLFEIRISLPPALRIAKESAEQFLLGLPHQSRPISFEIIGIPDSIAIQLVCREQDRGDIHQQLQAHFPDLVLTDQERHLEGLWEARGTKETAIIEFGLSREFMLPLRVFSNFETDPLIPVVGALANLQPGEIGVLQILFQSVRAPWAESVLRAVTDGEGNAFFVDAPEMVSLATEKVSRPLFAAVLRIGAQSPAAGRVWRIARALGGTLRQFTSPTSNELMALSNDDYPDVEHQGDLLCRRTRRGGLLLNSEELVSLVHPPSASVRVEKLAREERKTKMLPSIAVGHRLHIGENVHAGKVTPVTQSDDLRTKHTYMIGASGTGKSTLFLNLIVQDLVNGEGVGVLDPHGDLIDQILGHIPEGRLKDVVLLDAADGEYPIGFNILSAHSDLERTLLSSDLVAAFRRLSTSWGDQMTSVLGNAVLAFLESDQGGTLADLRRFLVEPEFRQSFLATVHDPEVVYYWRREFPLLVGKPQAPLLTRLDTFLRPKLVRYMVTQKENRLDFSWIMNEGKIFLAKLAQGAIGEENAYLLGSFVVSKFQQTAMSRQEVGVTKRRHFWLYIDECHNFITPSMAQILTGARKYHLGLVLAHEGLRQLLSRDTEVASSVFGASTRICFRVGDDDARKLEEGFSSFGAKDLQNLGTGEAICRMERSNFDFNLRTHPLPPVEPAVATQRREQAVAFSREQYATRREEVEVALRATAQEVHSQEKPPAPAAGIQDDKLEGPQKPRPRLPAAETRPFVHPVPPSPGIGGRQHKYLQGLIKRWTEEKGFRATIEKRVLDGLGSVDIVLEKDRRSIACEISVTSTPEQELGNIQKCLAAGFETIIVVALDQKNLSRIRELASSNLDAQALFKVRFFAPEELFTFLEEVEAQSAGSERTVRGYKVKVKYRRLAEDDKQARRAAISNVILRALKRLRGKNEEAKPDR
jgi:hypothetical protein